jgi:hypothetical protein
VTLSGYEHPLYAESFKEFGSAVPLPAAGAWVLRRSIPNSERADAMGCYPLLFCKHWVGLKTDIDQLSESGAVTFVAVPDPYAGLTVEQLSRCFDQVRPFKQRFAIQLDNIGDSAGTKHHRYYARKALREVDVEICEAPLDWLEDWVLLYEALVARHQLRGLHNLSRQALMLQLQVPGVRLFRASIGGETVAMHIWYVISQRAYSHLAASSPAGYAVGASYGLYQHAIDGFRSGDLGDVQLMDLGAGAGTSGNDEGGLTSFKRGWATHTQPTYLCGAVLDHPGYDQLCAARALVQDGYFPAYRAGEFS